MEYNWIPPTKGYYFSSEAWLSIMKRGCSLQLWSRFSFPQPRVVPNVLTSSLPGLLMAYQFNSFFMRMGKGGGGDNLFNIFFFHVKFNERNKSVNWTGDSALPARYFICLGQICTARKPVVRSTGSKHGKKIVPCFFKIYSGNQVSDDV